MGIVGLIEITTCNEQRMNTSTQVEIPRHSNAICCTAYAAPSLPVPLKADSQIACRAHAVPLPCSAAKRLECVFPI